jgi:hypothetical protein
VRRSRNGDGAAPCRAGSLDPPVTGQVGEDDQWVAVRVHGDRGPRVEVARVGSLVEGPRTAVEIERVEHDLVGSAGCSRGDEELRRRHRGDADVVHLRRTERRGAPHRH